MKTKLITVVLAAILAGAAFWLAYLSASDDPANAISLVDKSTVLAPGTVVSLPPLPPQLSTEAPQPTTTAKPLVTTSTTKVPAPSVTTDTTTPNMPPERSETLSARVPSSDAQIRFCEQINKPLDQCRIPESAGMAEDPQDFSNETDHIEDTSAQF